MARPLSLFAYPQINWNGKPAFVAKAFVVKAFLSLKQNKKILW
jgi:hypothetical protein